MKKIYLTLATGLFLAQNLSAQLVLTKSANDPVVGDLNAVMYYDTTTALPLNTGANQTWNFSSLTIDPTSLFTTTFVPISTSTAAAQFSGATIAEHLDTDSYAFYKSDATQTEALGQSFPGGSIQFTNSMVMYKWPTAYGNTHTDNFSGQVTTSFGNITLTGTLTSLASGSGNIILPGGASYSNILQLKVSQSMTVTMTVPIPTTEVTELITYTYFHSSNKFPLLTVTYDESNEATVTVNKNVAVGLTDYNFDASFAIYPNPARNNFNVRLSNAQNKECVIDIYNSTGQLVKNYNLGSNHNIESNVAIGDLAPGIYMVKTSLGQKTSTRRLIVE